MARRRQPGDVCFAPPSCAGAAVRASASVGLAASAVAALLPAWAPPPALARTLSRAFGGGGGAGWAWDPANMSLADDVRHTLRWLRCFGVQDDGWRWAVLTYGPPALFALAFALPLFW